MKAITLTQPWASLVALGAKRIETRSWTTKYRGPLAIHAGTGLGPVGGKRGLYGLCYRDGFREVLEPAMEGSRKIAGITVPHYDAAKLPRGAIIAIVTLTACVPTDSARHIGGDDEGWSTEIAGQRWPLTDQEHDFGDYTSGRYAWLLDSVRRLDEPVPCKGALGLWTVPAEIAAMLSLGFAAEQAQRHGGEKPHAH